MLLYEENIGVLDTRTFDIVHFSRKEQSIGDTLAANTQKKVYWYSKAAKAGHIDAQRDLGYSYFYGEGVNETRN